MANTGYDIITVGGGLGGAALAKSLAERGARVLVLEREKRFKDRIRGEFLAPWGVVETQALGLYDLLRATCARECPALGFYTEPNFVEPRDLITTTAQKLPAFTFYHPAMQEVILEAAAEAGAEIRREAHVRNVTAGDAPSVEVEQDGRVEEIKARLVVGADGRNSVVRKWAGFAVQHDPERLILSGVLFEEMGGPQEGTIFFVVNPNLSLATPMAPQGGGRVRAYLVQTKATGTRLQGAGDVPRFISESIKSGVPAEWYENARPVGPLATFDGADSWVDRPYSKGVALIGDAAAATDPSWGQGLSLTLTDVRILRDLLLRNENWDEAGHAYAEAHDADYAVIHRVENWLSEMFFGTGPAAEALRSRAFPLFAADPARVPDLMVCGPDVPADETDRRRFFGDE